MAIYKYGTFIEPAKTATSFFRLNLGFIPSVFRMRDITQFGTVSPSSGVIEGYWSATLGALPIPASLLYTYNSGIPTVTASTVNGINPFISNDTQLFTPQQAPYINTTSDRQYLGASTNQVISLITNGITQAVNALVTTAEAHSFTTADIGVTTVTFHGVPGMTQINNLSGVIQSVPTTTTFTVNINTTNFSAYSTTGGTVGLNSGFFNVITGAPASTQYGNQILNTAEANLGFIGLTIGSDFMNGATNLAGDTWEYEAILMSPATGP